MTSRQFLSLAAVGVCGCASSRRVCALQADWPWPRGPALAPERSLTPTDKPPTLPAMTTCQQTPLAFERRRRNDERQRIHDGDPAP